MDELKPANITDLDSKIEELDSRLFYALFPDADCIFKYRIDQVAYQKWYINRKNPLGEQNG